MKSNDQFRKLEMAAGITGTRFVRIELLGGWDYPSDKTRPPSANASRLSWDSASKDYAASDPPTKIRVFFPDAERDDAGEYTGQPTGTEGDRYLAFFAVEPRRWEIFSGQANGLTPYQIDSPFTYDEEGGPPTTTGRPLVRNPDSGEIECPEQVEGEEDQTVDIYFSMAPSDSEDYYVGVPVGQENDWVWCVEFGGKVEVVYFPDSIYLVTLDEVLLAEGTTTGYIVHADDQRSIPIVDLLMEPGDQINAGTDLIVHWSELHRAFVPIAKLCADEEEEP